jgi:hypothetical protein
MMQDILSNPYMLLEKGDRGRQETSGKRQETRDKRQGARDRGQETRDRGQGEWGEECQMPNSNDK